MRIKILVSSALINEEKGRWAGLAEEIDVPRERGEYLVSVGAAKALEDDEADQPDAETEAPQGDGGNAAGTSTPEAPAAPEEKKAAPVRRAAPKSK